MNKTFVSEILLPSSRTLAAKESDAIETAIQQFVHQPDVHTLFIVDEHEKLKGLLKLHFILNWVKLKLGMDLSDRASMRVSGTFQAFEILKLCQSQTIGDIISPAATVRSTDTLEQALHILVHEQLEELPVVDESGKLIGEVRLTQLLSRMLEATPGTGPACQA